MAETPKKREVPVTELALSLSYQFEALVQLLERKEVVSREELFTEIRVTITNSGEDGANPSPLQAR